MIQAMAASCAAFFESSNTVQYLNLKFVRMRLAWAGMGKAWQCATIGNVNQSPQGGRWRRERLSFPLAPCWAELPAHCAGIALLMADHICARRGLGGKLERQDVVAYLFTPQDRV
tara:strand:+ start:335 stop:679 length:345 start_codon:yes stop_codon:yes gene_type:complete